MKRSTILAIVFGLVGVGVILYFATRPRTTAGSLTTGGTEGAPTDATGQASRVVRGVGGGLTEIAAGIADLA